MDKAEKEKIVRALLETYEDDSERHQAYKSMLKGIIMEAIFQLADEEINSVEEMEVWVDGFLERIHTKR